MPSQVTQIPDRTANKWQAKPRKVTDCSSRARCTPSRRIRTALPGKDGPHRTGETGRLGGLSQAA